MNCFEMIEMMRERNRKEKKGHPREMRESHLSVHEFRCSRISMATTAMHSNFRKLPNGILKRPFVAFVSPFECVFYL